jgi:hypothetical protein
VKRQAASEAGGGQNPQVGALGRNQRSCVRCLWWGGEGAIEGARISFRAARGGGEESSAAPQRPCDVHRRDGWVGAERAKTCAAWVRRGDGWGRNIASPTHPRGWRDEERTRKGLLPLGVKEGGGPTEAEGAARKGRLSRRTRPGRRQERLRDG